MQAGALINCLSCKSAVIFMQLVYDLQSRSAGFAYMDGLISKKIKCLELLDKLCFFYFGSHLWGVDP